MNFEVTSKKLDSISASCLVLFAFEGKKGYESSVSLKDLDKKLDGMLSKILSEEKFDGKEKSQVTVYSNNKILAPKIIIIGLGKKKELTNQTLKSAFASVAKNRNKNTSSIAVSLLTSSETHFSESDQAQAISLGILLGNYKFGKYQKKDEEKKELEIVIFSTSKNENLSSSVSFTQKKYEAIKLARDLVNEQASFVTPTHLGKIAKEIAQNNKNISCAVYNKEQIEKMGMEAFLGVAKGADTPPVFIHLEYTPPNYKGKEKLAIVGKGITFDTGGVSLKPSQYMTTMKCDMAGAASVLGLFSIVTSVRPKIAVMGLIAATPNLVSGRSMVPGDVVKALNGKTIEVLNTDAEGRVTLADSLSYAVKNGASKIIDMATLTGACMVGLGADYAGLFGNNKEFKDKVLTSAEKAGEKVWELPLVKEYKELNKSDVADVANLGSSPYGGAITAALFLEEFIDNKPWVHLDIAGPAFAEKEHPLGPKGGTGFGVATLINLLKG